MYQKSKPASVAPVSVLTIALAAGLPAGVAAQDAPFVFDTTRAWVIDTTMYVPFQVETTIPLHTALSEGRINEGTELLVMEHEIGALAVSRDQMAYHHVAQGFIDGEPWMISF